MKNNETNGNTGDKIILQIRTVVVASDGKSRSEDVIDQEAFEFLEEAGFEKIQQNKKVFATAERVNKTFLLVYDVSSRPHRRQCEIVALYGRAGQVVDTGYTFYVDEGPPTVVLAIGTCIRDWVITCGSPDPETILKYEQFSREGTILPYKMRFPTRLEDDYEERNRREGNPRIRTRAEWKVMQRPDRNR